MNQLKAYYNKNFQEVGCDEAGRGCLAGPVVAAAVILPLDFHHPLLNDSKQLSEKQRFELRPYIEQHALAWAIGVVDAPEIDRINILNASILAMHRAIDKLAMTPEHILVDGNRFKPYPSIPHTCIVKGDATYKSIAAASVLAKTFRDEQMDGLHELFPQYNWKKNKGYPTVAHRAAISQYGITEWHRTTFKLLPD